MKLLIGGSPCTHWSVAQTKNRETEASGNGGGLGAKTGLYATPVGDPGGKAWPVYEVRGGFQTSRN